MRLCRLPSQAATVWRELLILADRSHSCGIPDLLVRRAGLRRVGPERTQMAKSYFKQNFRHISHVPDQVQIAVPIFSLFSDFLLAQLQPLVMKRAHDDDQVELAGALTSLRSEAPHINELGANGATTSKEDRFTGPPVEKRHATWAAWAKHLDDYCHSNGVRIGIEFTDSVQKRNDEMRNSKRAKDGKFVRYLPEELEAYRRSYVCHLGRKGRTRDVKFRRTACPFKLVAKSVFDGGNWEVEVTCSNAEHIHSETTGGEATTLASGSKEPESLLKPVFPIEGLKGSPPSRKVLMDMAPRCKRMPENEAMCTRLLQRLNDLHDSVAPIDEKDLRKQVYTDVVIRFVKLMRRKQLLLRLASSETVVFKIHELHEKLNGLARGFEVSSTEELDQLRDDRAEQYAKLQLLVSSASDRMLINEFRGDQKLHEALMTLTSGMRWKNQSPEMLALLALKRDTFARVTKILPGLPTAEWFIPVDDLEYEERVIGAGTFGEARRATWLHYGERREVIVKHLFKEIEHYSADMFLKQLEFWYTIEDQHILKLLGGSHVDRPQFYVCEYASGGNLRDFFGQRENRTRLWRMFRQAARGLLALHTAKLPHGALKCSNILVGANNTVKLTDFGFRPVRSLSASLSADADEATAIAVRWKPKELLEETHDQEQQYRADIYALGMCMIEALTQQDPFAKVDNNQLVEVIRKGTTHDRPDAILDAEWVFICRLCNPDDTQRPKLVEVLKEIGVFAEEEQQRDDLLQM